MVEQEHTPAGAQHPGHLGDSGPVVRDAAQAQRGNDRVERVIGEHEVLGVPHPQDDLRGLRLGAATCTFEHAAAEIHARQVHPRGVVGQVAAGADGHFQYPAPGLSAGPPPAVTEQNPLGCHAEHAAGST